MFGILKHIELKLCKFMREIMNQTTSKLYTKQLINFRFNHIIEKKEMLKE